MIELLRDLPGEVVGFTASGQVTAHDYESVVIPAIEAKLKEHGKVRILYQIGSTFSGFSAGAVWDDAKLGITRLKAWEKIAVVTDVDWITGAVGLLGFAMTCPVKVFPNGRYTEALEWIAA